MKKCGEEVSMFNLIRADLYRVWHGKEIKLCCLLTVVWVVLCGYAISATAGMREALAGTQLTTKYWNTFFCYYPVVLPQVVFCSYYAANDFKQRTVTHYIEKGISRWKYYFSKLMVGWLISVLFLILAFGAGIVCYQTFFSDSSEMAVTVNGVLLYVIGEALCHMAVATFIISMCFFIRNSTVCMAINFICFFFGTFVLKGVNDLLNLDYDLVSLWAYGSVSGISLGGNVAELQMAILIFAGYLIVFGEITMLFFRKRDIA